MSVTTQDSKQSFVRVAPIEAMPAPLAMTGVIGWMRASLFSGPLNTVLTLLTIGLIYLIIPPTLDFLIFKAAWTGTDREACLATAQHPEVGACWAFVRDRFFYFIYGSYPIPDRWRVDIFFGMLAIGIVWLLWLEAPRRDLGAIYFFVVVPIVSYALLNGFELIGLREVDTSLWGGVLVTIVVSWVGIVFSLPLGILLALGRRSNLPLIKGLCVGFIELIRGVPLISLLIMASVMLPLFLPSGMTFDKFLRAQVAVILFAGAYIAEIIRGGLQSLPKGQFEAADAMGLNYFQKTTLIILPQALRVVIPPLINTFIGFFKDTSLVLIIGIFDFLNTANQALVDPAWAGYPGEVYLFAAFVYFCFCYSMSRYSKYLEVELNKGTRR